MSIYVSLETVKKLKAAGWDKPTVWDYYNEDAIIAGARYYAPTTDEILAELPHSITLKSQKCELAMFKKNNSYEAGYFIGEFYQYAIAYEDKQLCEALAELWLWAKSNGYIADKEAGK